MNFTLLSLAVAAVTLVLPAVSRAAEDLPLEKKTYTDAAGKRLVYRLLKPESLDSKQKYPLVLFLHGAGERGDDNEAQLKHAVPEFTKPEVRKKYPCFLVAPQCPSKVSWADFRAKKPAEQPAEPLRLVIELLDQLQKEYPIDSNRIYVTGLSMGGFGTWDLLRRLPDRFAAAVPVCGGGDASAASKFVHVPIWAFHGAKDTAVRPQASRSMIDALKKAGGNPKYTEYPDVGHDSWVPAYKDGEMMAWLFAQRRSKPAPRRRGAPRKD